MSLSLSRLELVRELPGGLLQARCPACAEGGHDRTGEHLRIYPDGRFGCCVHPKDHEHRKRIWALAGERQSGTFTLRITPPAATAAAWSVKSALTQFKPDNSVSMVIPLSDAPDVSAKPYSGTIGTPKAESRAFAREELPDMPEHLQDMESGAPDIPTMEVPLKTAETIGADQSKAVTVTSHQSLLDLRTPRTTKVQSRAYAREEVHPVVKMPEKLTRLGGFDSPPDFFNSQVVDLQGSRVQKVRKTAQKWL